MTTAPAPASTDLEPFRVELTGYAYRMLGSIFDAEDAVQETLLRAWRARDGFDGRSSLRTWLYRIATNVCLDLLRGRGRRALPIDLGAPSAPVAESLGPPAGDWIGPVPDTAVLPADPAELAVARESVRLAFVAALQHLPPRQRAVLILREVLRWRADEVADLLHTSVPAVNSALQRARATLAEVRGDRPAGGPGLDPSDRDLLDRYVDAFVRYDIDALVALLHSDAVQSMPPYAMWLRGAADIGRWMTGPGAECRGSRLVRVAANGGPGLAQYRSDPAGGHRAFSIQVLDVADGRIVRLSHFLEPDLFARFGLPLRLDS
ncbi:sigma-70 family RNA polymerase sigma factor [Micromonospora auratinigra]|uniref:RNA polymerase sigma-70 factor, ECF subfamily n=1 Tax=Micromonospora auratinigra TaxID=261654 RepID=A0A1A9AB16_9ACTN|nr:sigma-70 family RNA polymerase sigma factor [Micromonospora auratinigra]SBT53390.1 RNA polymerase sigma-70 factor, ECF subfamily [Micromonospora auratinigra]